MPHFFVKTSDINENNVVVSDKETYNHIAKSLRARIGEALLFIDENQIQYETKITQITKSEIVAQILKHYKSSRDLEFNIYLAQSPLRSDSQNFVMEKSTELGIRGVYPVITDNCAVKRDIIEKKIDKWQKIMFEASKQCERAIIPKCFELTKLETLINDEKFDKIIAFCERISKKTLKSFVKENKINKNANVLVIIGPEGGFSDREFELFQNNEKVEMLTLGDLILKADTAVVVALGNIIYEFTNSIKN
ncbi:MAG: 16S rRNA (uracil(1498)-N(3))-methyltransferase [Clostridiaceae bacterium]|nr:16S rRNA (uracil(1498)-N(3))-methyltransferase [Clostridiaceae bacterium]